MLTIHPVTSLDLPELAPYRTLRRPVEHERQGIFIAEGDKVVWRLLETGLPVVSVLVTPEWLEKLRVPLESRAETVQAYVADRQLLENMVGFDLYQGVLVLARIPPPADLQEALQHSPRPRLWVALDGLNNSTNLGVMLRNCGAFRAQAILVGETCTSPWLRRSVRNSMGAIFRLPIVASTNLADDLRKLHSLGILPLAAHPRPGGRNLYQTDLTRDCCLVFGNEGDGISQPVLDACVEHVAIPMPSHLDSLNVGSAAAAFLSEASRQRATTRF